MGEVDAALQPCAECAGEHHDTGWQVDMSVERAAHTCCLACRLGVADGGVAIRSSALKKLEGDATVDGAQRAKVAVRTVIPRGVIS